MTGEPGVGLAVWTADCVPVLISGPGVLAAVHAGWRGSASGILDKALIGLEQHLGARRTELVVALGPAIGACCYPVGPEVIDALGAHGVDRSQWLSDERVDLRGFLGGQARRLGVGQVVTVGGCTACDRGLASYRRDGPRAGRQVSVAYLSGS
jgi:YfiH family protein